MRTYSTSIEPTPPPWLLRGTGYVVLYWFQRDPGRAAQFCQPHLADAWRGGPGSLTWMDYRESPVGPYREILFVPGQFAIAGRRSFSISRIYVETLASVIGGRANWGIPKDLAEFNSDRRADGTEILSAHSDGRTIARLIVHPLGPQIPLDTAFMPLPMMQYMDGKFFHTPLTLRGRVQFLDVVHIETDPTGSELPPLTGVRPLLALKLNDFAVTFPQPRIEPDRAARAAERLSDPT
ncbi:MAG: acetoacetate decarboxylase family protein [Candidatus Flexifilum sp.]